MKKCLKCNQIKPIKSFYKHFQMADGYLNKCKKCAIKDTKNRYYNSQAIIKIKKYEKKRSQNVERKKKVLEYQRKNRANKKGKYKARMKIYNAIRNGKIKKGKCLICGSEKVEAHHKDYRKWCDVLWLCFKHHRELHNQIILN